MNKGIWWGLGAGALALVAIPFVLALIAGLFFLAVWLVSVLWGWVVPDLFPKAVEQGLVARTISLWTAFKVVVVVAVIGGIAGGFTGKCESNRH